MGTQTTPAGPSTGSEAQTTRTWTLPQSLQVIGVMLLGAALAAAAVWLYLSRRLATGERPARLKATGRTSPESIEIPITLVAEATPKAEMTKEAPTADLEAAGEPDAASEADAAEAYLEAAAAGETASQAVDAAEGILWASIEGGKFHVPTCRWAQNIKPENRVEFAGRDKALALGYTPCGTCRP